MMVDYSKTINRFTTLDAYPLPKIEEVVKNDGTIKIYCTVNLKSAFHQVPKSEKDKIYTAFEADGKLYQFRRVPFGITNGVPCFSRIINKFIANYSLSHTFAYLDYINICGKSQEEHDENLDKFTEAAKKFELI